MSDYVELYRVSKEKERGFELLKSWDSWKDSFKVAYKTKTKEFNLKPSGVFYGDDVDFNLIGDGEFAWIWGEEEFKEGKTLESLSRYLKYSTEKLPFYNKEEEMAQDVERSYLYFAIEGNEPPFVSSLQANKIGYLPCRCIKRK